MDIEQQVCSLELAKKLKELGVKQESVWYWTECNNPDYGVIGEWMLIQKPSKNWNQAAAFTVAELGVLLPKMLEDEYGQKQWLDMYNGRGWTKGGKYVHEDEFIVGMKNIGLAEANTETNARAAMLIQLIEKGYITEADWLERSV